MAGADGGCHRFEQVHCLVKRQSLQTVHLFEQKATVICPRQDQPPSRAPAAAAPPAAACEQAPPMRSQRGRCVCCPLLQEAGHVVVDGHELKYPELVKVGGAVWRGARMHVRARP